MSDEVLIEAARRLASELPARSQEIEDARRLPADIAQQLADAGLFHGLVPEAYGGGEVHPSTFIRLIREVSTGDGSAGWNVMIGLTTGLLSASLPEEFAREIYGDGPGGLAVGVTAPMGIAEVVEGGYRVTGRWPFGSGSSNAGWIGGGCFITENGEQRIGKGGMPEHHIMMFERSQVEIEDTWHVSGLCGTGSHHFNVKDVFVPEGRSVVMGTRSRIQRPLYQFPLLGLLAMGVSAVSLGIGFKALAAFKELAGAKVPTGGNRGLAEQARVQSLVAESTADLESAEAYIHRVIDDAWEIGCRGERLPLESKARLRLAAVNATSSAVAAVDRLYQAGGGSAIYEDSVLQRCFRDVHVTTQHMMVGRPIYEIVGRVELGLDPKSLL
ncbi:MAG: acyl-CoA dehydrogenase family protein [Pseudomonadales bacterium]|nr:acyl-CoA dehydrogenase family protein [Pseudomonadales bacterium]